MRTIKNISLVTAEISSSIEVKALYRKTPKEIQKDEAFIKELMNLRNNPLMITGCAIDPALIHLKEAEDRQKFSQMAIKAIPLATQAVTVESLSKIPLNKDISVTTKEENPKHLLDVKKAIFDVDIRIIRELPNTTK